MTVVVLSEASHSFVPNFAYFQVFLADDCVTAIFLNWRDLINDTGRLPADNAKQHVATHGQISLMLTARQIEQQASVLLPLVVQLKFEALQKADLWVVPRNCFHEF